MGLSNNVWDEAWYARWSNNSRKGFDPNSISIAVIMIVVVLVVLLAVVVGGSVGGSVGGVGGNGTSSSSEETEIIAGPRV